MDAMAASGIETTIFFYNPNIHPRTEYELRKEENIRYAEKLGMEFVDSPITTRTIGSSAFAAWSKSPSVVRAVRCVLTCASSVRLCMRRKTDSI
jgi:predicted adenine nucleotide alpha hydrolase (AANH) superfamily ATPase